MISKTNRELIAVTVVAMIGCQSALAGQEVLHMSIGAIDRKDKQVELRLDGITDTVNGDLITPPELARRLAPTGLLFIGETHTNLDFHKVQLRAVRALHEAGREVMIGLEMFPYTQQAALDDWVAGKYSEQEFLEAADWFEYWSYNWEYYREIFVYARDNGIRMYGVNTPRDVVKAVREKGFKDLTPEEAAHIPHEVKPITPEQREMFKAFFDPDDALHMNDEALEGMLRAQTVWDATMGWNALQALQKGGDNAIMVVLIGSGHVTYGLGAERQTDPYYEGVISSVIPLEVADDECTPVTKVQASYANFLWGLPRQEDEAYPSLGVSLMGPLGEQPTTVIQLSEGSVAERAGIAVGDVLLKLDGQSIDSSRTLRKTVASWRWGDEYTALVEREGKQQEINIPVRRERIAMSGCGK